MNFCSMPDVPQGWHCLPASCWPFAPLCAASAHPCFCLLVVGILLPSVPLCKCTSMHLPSSLQHPGQRNFSYPPTTEFSLPKNLSFFPFAKLLAAGMQNKRYVVPFIAPFDRHCIGGLLDPSSPFMHKRANCEPFLQHLYFTPFFVTFFHQKTVIFSPFCSFYL